MTVMTSLHNMLAIFIAAMGIAAGAAAQTAAPHDGTDPNVVALLDRLEARGRSLHSYQASVVYTREQGLLADSQTRIGRVVYQAADANTGRPPRFAVRFESLIVDDALRKRPRAYLFDGRWLAEVHADSKQFIRREVTRPGETYDPLKIGEGPFPLPLGQKRREVLDLYHVTRIDPNDGDPNDSTHLHLEPRGEAPHSDLTQIDIWYSNQTLLPVKIATADDAENLTTVWLRDAKVNQLAGNDLDEQFDTTPPTKPGWKVEVIPLPPADGDKPIE